MTEARSRESILVCDPKEVIQADWLDVYERNILIVGGELRRLNGNIYLFEKISGFPWNVFRPNRLSEHFWFLTWLSLFESAVLGLWRIAADSDHRGLTLSQLRSQILLHIVEERKPELRQLFRSVSRGHLKELERSVTALRDNHIAHLNLEERLKTRRTHIEPALLPLKELLSYRDTATELFRVLCLGRATLDYPLGYYPGFQPSVLDDPRTDMEQMLDHIADQSSVMMQFREGGKSWETLQQLLGKEKSEPLIEYAARLKRFER